jgi:hypothetical protein
MSVAVRKVMLSKNNTATKIPCKKSLFSKVSPSSKLIYYQIPADRISSINALYMDPAKNIPFLVSPRHNSLEPCISWTEAKRWSNSFQLANHGPIRSRLNFIILNFIIREEVSVTFAKVSPLWRIILYKAGYYSRKMVAPNHLYL